MDEGKKRPQDSSRAAAAVRQIAAMIERAIADERHACAEVAEEFATAERGSIAEEIAAKIRARAAAAERLDGLLDASRRIEWDQSSGAGQPGTGGGRK